MSETETETTETTGTAAASNAAPSNAELDAKVTALDGKIDKIIDMFSGKEGQARAAAQQHTEDRLDRPTTVAEEIRQQLADAKAAEAADAEKRGSADRLAALEAKVTGMTEQTPEAPVRRVEKLWGWR